MSSDYFTPKQREVIREANKPFNFLCGAVRSGKTFISYFLIPLRIKQHQANECYFVGKTLTTLDRNIFEPMRKIFGEDAVGKVIDKRYIYLWGKKCWCVGANDDRAVTKIQGGSAGYFYCDEIVTYPQNFFEMLISRLDKAGSICDATCNPESPSHYIKQFLDKPENQKYIYNKHFTIFDNPKLPQETVERLCDLYKGTIFYDRWILGNWVRTEGLVFPLFNREKHLKTLAQLSAANGYNTKTIKAVIIGGDGATTNDSTALVPLAIFNDGTAVVLDIFYYNPKTSGQRSNAQLMPLINQWLIELINKYSLQRGGVRMYCTVDCAAADLVLTLRSNFPQNIIVRPFTKKDILSTTDVVNNAFSLNKCYLADFGGYKDYATGRFVEALNPLVVDLENMIWDGKRELHYDDSVPNDVADAFRYAINTYYNNPENLWDTPVFKGM